MFEYVSEKFLDNILEKVKDKYEVREVKKDISQFEESIIKQHKENPDFEPVSDFLKSRRVFETILENLLLNSEENYNDVLKEFEQDFIQENSDKSINLDLYIRIVEQFDHYIGQELNSHSSLSKVDLAREKKNKDDIISNNSREIENMKKTLEELVDLVKEMKQNKFILYKKESIVKNFRFTFPVFNELEYVVSSNYQYSFHLFNSFEFEGDFGENPTVYLIYSNDDNPIKFKTQEHGLQAENLSIMKLDNISDNGDSYKYIISMQSHYFSNNNSEFDIRPFVVVILGENNIGFITLTIVNKTFGGTTGNGAVVARLFGQAEFSPQARILLWPKKNDLLKNIKEPQTGKVFYLEKKDIEGILELEQYFRE